MDRSGLGPAILKRAAELFEDGLTVREVAAALKISKSEAGGGAAAAPMRTA